MVYYVDDNIDKGWCVPIHLKVRDLYDMSDRYTSGYVSEAFQSQHLPFEDDRTNLVLSRPGFEAELD